MGSPRITYTPRSDTMPEAELSTLAIIYKFILFDSQAHKGGTHDVMRYPTKNRTRTDKKGMVNADLRGD